MSQAIDFIVDRSVKPSKEQEMDCKTHTVSKSQRRSYKLAAKYGINTNNSLLEESYETCRYCSKTFSTKLDALIHNRRHLSVTLKRAPLLKEKLSVLHGDIDQLKDMMIVKLSKPSSKPPATKSSVIQGDGQGNVNELRNNILEKLLNKPRSCPSVHGKISPKPEKVLSNFVADCQVKLEPMICDDENRDFETHLKTLAQIESLRRKPKPHNKTAKSKEVHQPTPHILSSFTNDCAVVLDDPLLAVRAEKDVREVERPSGTMYSRFTDELEASQIFNGVTNKSASPSFLQPNPNGNMEPSHAIELSDDDDRPEDTIMCRNDYDSLISPLICYCPLCPEVLPNRFELYKHKMTHLRVEFKYRLELVTRRGDTAPTPLNFLENTNTYVKYTSHCGFCVQSFPSIFELIRHLTLHIKDNNITPEEFSACHSLQKACDDCVDLEKYNPKLIGEVYFEKNVSCTICKRKKRRLNLYPKSVIAKKTTVRETVTVPETVIDLCEDEREQVNSRGEHDDSKGEQDDAKGEKDDSRGEQDDSRGEQDDARGEQDDSRGELAGSDKLLQRLLQDASNSDFEMLITHHTLQKPVSKLGVSRPKKSRRRPKSLSSVRSKLVQNRTQQVHCSFCTSTFKCIVDLITHLTVHAGERRIPPELAGMVQKVFRSCRKCIKSVAVPHWIIGELNCESRCSMCDQLNVSLILHREATEQNNLSVTEQKYLEVQESSDTFEADGTKPLAANGRPVHCAFCKLTFKYILELLDHLEIHASEGIVEPVELDEKDSQMVYMACKSCYELMSTPPCLMGELTWAARCSFCSKPSSHFHLYRQRMNQQKATIIDLCEDEMDDNVQEQGDSRSFGAAEGAGSPNSFRRQSNSSIIQESADSDREQAESRNPILVSFLDGAPTDSNDPNSKIKTKPKRTVIHCALCDAKFNRVIELSRHMSTHHAREGKMSLQNELAREAVYIICQRCHEMERMSPTQLGTPGSELRCFSCRKLHPDTNFDIKTPQNSQITIKDHSIQDHLGFGIDKWVQEQANASSSREYSYSDLGSLILDSENASLTRLRADTLITGEEHVGSTIHTNWGQINFETDIAPLQVQASSNINNIAGIINDAPWNKNISTDTQAQTNEIVTLRQIISPAVDNSQSFINSYINTVWEHPNPNQASDALISVPLNSGKQSGSIISEPSDSDDMGDYKSADPNWTPRWFQGIGLDGPRGRGRSRGRPRGRCRGRPPGRDRGRYPGRGSLPRLLPRLKPGKILSIKERIAFEDDSLTTSRVKDHISCREYTRGKMTNAMRLINIQKRLKDLKRYN